MSEQNHVDLGPEEGDGAGRRRDGLLTTGDMARLSSSTLRTVRFYEEEGLLKPTQRTEGGHRLFAHTELEKLKLVGELRRAGFSLEEIRDMLEVKARAANGANASADAVARLDEHIRMLGERLALMQRLVAQLERTRSLLARCAECHDDPHFPNNCTHCQVMESSTEIPSAVSVIWGVER